MYPHTLAHVNIECPENKYPKLKIYISQLILDGYENLSVTYVKMHDII